jgi:HlyD family secretion protein
MEAEGNVGITQLRSDYALQQAESQWQSAYQRYQQAQRDLEQLQEGPDQDQIRRLELLVEQAEVALEQATADLDLVRLTAPFAGIVSAVNLQENTAAPAGLPAVRLLDDTKTYVDLSIDEIDIGSIEPDQAVSLALDAYPDVGVTGVVERIDPVPQTSTGIVAYPVRVRITDANGAEVREGMTASAQIRVGQKENVVLVPNWAVRTDQSSEEVYTYCYCVEDGAPRRVMIETGLRNDTWTEVVSGLDAGATIALVTEPQNLLELQGPPSRGLD